MEGQVTATRSQGVDYSLAVIIFIVQSNTPSRSPAPDADFEYTDGHKGSSGMVAATDDTARWRGPVDMMAGKTCLRGWGCSAEDVAREISTTLANLVPGFRAKQPAHAAMPNNLHMPPCPAFWRTL